MATKAKTITLEIDAYEKLRRAKRSGESFSSVVRRAILPGPARSGKEVIAYLHAAGPFFSDEELDAIEAVAGSDEPPVNPWEETSK